MSLREASTPNTAATTISTLADDDNSPRTPKSQPPPPPSLSQRAISQGLTSTANLANLLPTGTLLAFQLLIPIFTDNGSCDSATRPMTFVPLALLAASCFLASFTDGFRSPDDGQVYYGFATFRGMWLFHYPPSSSGLQQPDLSKYRLNFIDGVHAMLSVFVFVAVSLSDKNVLSCFHPVPAHETQVQDIVPTGIGLGIGLICSLLFVVFPSTRHGIGYPVSRGK